MKKKILTILICGFIVLGLTGCGENKTKKTTDIKNYLESIGYDCKDYEGSQYSCSLEENNILHNFIMRKSDEEYSEYYTVYERTWSDGSTFRISVNSYINNHTTTYKEFNTGIRFNFEDVKANENLDCKFYEEHYKGEDKLYLCREDISIINEAKNYFEDIMKNANINLK